MEILIHKVPMSDGDDAKYYDGVIAYGTAADNKAYVLKVFPLTRSQVFNSMFVIYEAKQTQTQKIFKADDEVGEGIVFSWYDEAIEGFEYFLSNYCLEYRDKL